MRIDMIRTILCIVFQHDHYALLPDRALAQVFDKLSYRQIVVGYIGKRCWRTTPQSGRMVVSDPDDVQLRQAPAAISESKSAFHWLNRVVSVTVRSQPVKEAQ